LICAGNMDNQFCRELFEFFPHPNPLPVGEGILLPGIICGV